MGNGWRTCNTPNCQEPKHADCINGIGSCSCSKNNQNGVLETNKNCNLCQGSGIKMQRTRCGHCARHCDARNRTLVDLKSVQNTIKLYNGTIKRQKEQIKKLKANQQKELVFTDQNRSKFLSKSTNKKQKIQQLTSLTNISSKQNDAQKLTNDILNKPINNNLNDRNTLLNILGNISKKNGSDNTWLHPFQDPKNWYRCYHGTGSSNNNSGNSVDVMSFIFAGGFKMAGATMYGPGVYCSPDPKWLESSYAGTHVLNGKKYKFMLQCAVRPNGVRIYQDPHCGKNWQGGKPYGPIWVANSTTDIRAYAILIKEC